MDTYLKVIGIALIGILLCLILSKNAKDFSVILVIVLCCIVFGTILVIVKPILLLLDKLSQLSSIGNEWLEILLKVTGLALLGETVSTVCSDAGHAAVGKSIQTLTTVTILWISLPLIQSLMDLIQSVLEML